MRDVELHVALLQCQHLVGEDNWQFFASWVLGDRTQDDIAQEIGILRSSVGMRFRKYKQQCQSLVSPP